MAARELIVDSFAGFGGASLGIKWALGREPDIALNHSPKALAVHAANHPRTKHLREDVLKTDPQKATEGKPVGLLWASPDCTHHSRAKGGTPVKKEIRGLAWAVVRWALAVRPRVILLENVREFEQWGPLCPQWKCGACSKKGPQGQFKLARRKPACPKCDSTDVRSTGEQVPDPAKKGLTFKQFVGRLRGLGYRVEWRSLNAADYGAPTHRHRLFLVARNDGRPIEWPEPTHGDPATLGKGLFDDDRQPWRTAAECIDWDLECPSIFMTKRQAKKWAKERGCAPPRRPLEPNTLKRIALGIKRYVLDNPRPFVVANTTGNPPTGVEEPLKTVTTGNHHFLVTPLVARIGQTGGNGAYSNDAREPLTTITTKAEHLLVAPVLAHVTHQGDRRAISPDEPLPSITGANRGEIALVAPVLVQSGYDEREGQQPRVLNIKAPLGTVVAGGTKHAMVAAFLAKHYGGVVGHDLERPIGTVTAVDHHSLAVANLVHLNRGEKTYSGCDEPNRTITAGGRHAALVYSFLTKYHGSGGQWADMKAPMPTADCKDRHALITVTIEGQEYAIVDIGMRMLRPRELARGNGFPDSYILSTELTASATDQVKGIGNSVPPHPVCALVRANCADLIERTVAA